MLLRVVFRWALAAVAVPVAAAGVRRIGHAVEARRGSTPLTRMFARSADALQTLAGRNRRRGRRR